MSKFWVVCKREYLQIVKKKSFLIGIILTPVLMAGMMIVPALLATKASSTADHMTIVDQSATGMGEKLVTRLAEYTLPDSELPAFDITLVNRLKTDDGEPIEDSLRRAIDDKREKYALMIKHDPLASEENLYLVSNSDDIMAIRRFEKSLTDVVSTMRVESAELGVSVDSIMSLTKWVDLPQKNTKGEAIPFFIKLMTAIVLVMMIYMLIIMNGQTLMRSVIEEKTSRIMEVLVSSVSPFQLMLGKVIGFGAAAFTQVAIWVILGGVMFTMSGAMALNIDSGVAQLIFNPTIVIYFVLLFITGYILFSTVFALIGSMVNSDKEAQSFMLPIVMTLIIPVMMSSAIARDPNAAWVTVLSFVPFFSSTMMMMRVIFIAPSAVNPSMFSGIALEAGISVLLAIVAIIAVVWLTAKVFRVGILMYGKRPTLPELIKWIKY